MSSSTGLKGQDSPAPGNARGEEIGSSRSPERAQLGQGYALSGLNDLIVHSPRASPGAGESTPPWGFTGHELTGRRTGGGKDGLRGSQRSDRIRFIGSPSKGECRSFHSL